jgi:hypothetical protein
MALGQESRFETPTKDGPREVLDEYWTRIIKF